MAEKKYKFIVAFEDSVCRDYITEIIFQVSNYDIIPIVNGKGYKGVGFPMLSYIDVLDFESVEDMAKYLQYLDTNDTAYNEYFR